MKQTTLHIEAHHEGTNLGRLEGYRLIVQALGGSLDLVQAKPVFDDEWWLLNITLMVPPDSVARASELARKMFDGATDVRETGTREAGE